MWIVPRIFVNMVERIRAQLHYSKWYCLHMGCITHTFRVSSSYNAKVHSPDVDSSICS